MPTARTQTIVTGAEEILSLAKPGQGGGGTVYTPIGCMSKMDKTHTKDSLQVSCRQFKGKIPSGTPAESSISVDGYRYIYATANVAAQVSYDELVSYIDGPALSFQHTTGKTDDKIYTRMYVIKDVKVSAGNDDLETYSLTLESSGPEVVTVSL
jgi:hypothetical protein